MNLIAAVDKNWGIGKDGKLLFSIKRDMRFFRETTTGHIVVMGRKTLESFPGSKPLKNRINIVLTRKSDYKAEGAVICASVENALDELKKYDDNEIFIIGGAEIYSQFLPFCKKAYITKVDAVKDSDAKIENLDENADWYISDCSEDFSDDGLTYRFCEYTKK